MFLITYIHVPFLSLRVNLIIAFLLLLEMIGIGLSNGEVESGEDWRMDGEKDVIDELEYIVQA